MKVNTIKFIFSLVISLLLGFLGYIIAPEAGDRNWITFAVASVTIFSALCPAIGLDYNNPKRGASVKVFAWIMTLSITALNAVFAFFEYKIDVYVAVSLLLSIVVWLVIYALVSAKSDR